MEWYNGETKITPSNNTANTCTYDSSITLPSNEPTKTGYTFGGWVVRVASNSQQTPFDLSTWNAGTYARSGYTEGDNEGYNEATYGLTRGSGEWAAEFTNGIIKGATICSNEEGDHNEGYYNNDSSNWTATEADLLANSEYGYVCWCKVIGFDAEKSGNYVPVQSAKWVYRYPEDDEYDCKYKCARHCTEQFESAGYTRAMLGQSN